MMPLHRQDHKRIALTPPGQVNDLEHAALTPPGEVIDLWMILFDGITLPNPVPLGNFADRAFFRLRDLGHTGSLHDMWHQFWLAQAESPPVQIISDPAFVSPGDWTIGDAWTIGGGEAVCDGTQVALTSILNVAVVEPVEIGETYRAVVDVTAVTAGTCQVLLGGAIGAGLISVPGTFQADIVAVSTAVPSLRGNTSFDGVLNNFTVTKLDALP